MGNRQDNDPKPNSSPTNFTFTLIPEFKGGAIAFCFFLVLLGGALADSGAGPGRYGYEG